MTSLKAWQSHYSFQSTKYSVFARIQEKTNISVNMTISEPLIALITQSWQKPSTISPTSRHIENGYRTQKEGAFFKFKHPMPNSITLETTVLNQKSEVKYKIHQLTRKEEY